MERFQVIPIDSSFQVFLSQEKLPFSNEITEEVDRIWFKALHRSYYPSLFNGRLIHADTFTADQVIGRIVEYRYFFAQSGKIEKPLPLGICVTAVSGIIRADKKILIARRAGWVTTDPLYWELAPSGTLNPDCRKGNEIDYRKHMVSELIEETEIEQQEVIELKPFALFYDKRGPSLDIGVEIHVQPDVSERMMVASPEYTDFIWLNEQELEEFIQQHGDEFVSLSLEMLKFIL